MVVSSAAAKLAWAMLYFARAAVIKSAKGHLRYSSGVARVGLDGGQRGVGTDDLERAGGAAGGDGRDRQGAGVAPVEDAGKVIVELGPIRIAGRARADPTGLNQGAFHGNTSKSSASWASQVAPS